MVSSRFEIRVFVSFMSLEGVTHGTFVFWNMPIIIFLDTTHFESHKSNGSYDLDERLTPISEGVSFWVVSDWRIE